MASAISKTDKSSIEQIEMGCFVLTPSRVATLGVGTCICFLVILNDGQEIFLEHRSDDYLPQENKLTKC